jgi:anti-anti-sigma regulatory factor
MRDSPYNAVCEANTVELRLPARVDNFDLALLLNRFVACEQYRVCLDVSRVLRLGTVEFRVLGSFAEQFERHGGFLRFENVNPTLAKLAREFGFTGLVPVVSENQSTRNASRFGPE